MDLHFFNDFLECSHAATSPKKVLTMGVSWSKALEWGTVFFTMADLVDAVLDYLYTEQLSREGFVGEAAWMGIMATMALALELFVKLPLHRRKKENSGPSGGTLDLDADHGKTMMLLASADLELTIFLLEVGKIVGVHSGLYMAVHLLFALLASALGR